MRAFLILILIVLVTPASAGSFAQTSVSILSSETLCGFRFPESTKLRFVTHATSELGGDGDAAMATLREQADRTVDEVRKSGGVKQYCEDMKLFVALATALH